MEPELTLQVGKTYALRNGRYIKIVRETAHFRYPYEASTGDYYQKNGRYVADDMDADFDIVSEVPVVPETDFSGDPRYARLRNTLLRAYLQVAEGKGAVRHGSDKPWVEQPMFKIAEVVGTGFHLGQALKKIEESTRLDDEAAVKELLGAITYIAAGIEAIEAGHR